MSVITANELDDQLYIKIPSGEKKENIDENVVVALVDTSGSMSSDYKRVAAKINTIRQNSPGQIIHSILFSDIVQNIGNNDLPMETRYGRTNITAGLRESIKKIKEYVGMGKKKFTFVFVSDGLQNTGEPIEDFLESKLEAEMVPLITKEIYIDVLIVGIGKEFPSFISFNMRDKMHRGRENIKLLYLIGCDNNRTKDEEFHEAFEDMSDYFSPVPKQNIIPAARVYPWSTQMADSVYENTWCSVPEGNLIDGRIIIGEKDYLVEVTDWSMTSVISIFTQWTNKLNSMSAIKKDNNWDIYTKDSAKLALGLMIHINNQVMGDILKETSIQEYAKMSCKQRLRKALRKGTNELNLFITKVKQLVDGQPLHKLTDQELAQRAYIGTVDNKFSKRLLKARGELTIEEFHKLVQEFVEIIEKHSVKLLDYDDEKALAVQERDMIALENLHDIVTQDDLIECLRECPNQYLLLQNALSLVGAAFEVKRGESGAINPYAIRILSHPMTNKVSGTIAMLEYQKEHENLPNFEQLEDPAGLSPDGLAMIPGGQQGNYQMVYDRINAIIPLFKEYDENLRPFVRSRLFTLLSTWGFMRTADTLVSEVVMAGLAQMLCYCIQTPDAYKRSLLGCIKPTLDMVYSGRKMFDDYLSVLSSHDYYRCMVTASEKNKGLKCEAISKPLLFLWYLGDSVELDHRLDVIRSIYRELVARLVSNYDFVDFYTPVFSDEFRADLKRTPELDELTGFGLNPPETYYTDTEYVSAAETAYKKFAADLFSKEYVVGHEFNREKLESIWSLPVGDVTIRRMREFLLEHLGPEHTEESLGIDLESLVYTGLKNKNSFERHCNDDLTPRVYPSAEEVRSLIHRELLDKAIATAQKKGLVSIQKNADKLFTTTFLRLHKYAVPLSKGEIARIKGDDYLRQVEAKVIKMVNNGTKPIYDYNPDTNLIRSACMCPACPFFLERSTRIMNHLNPWVVQKEWVPSLHKACKINPNRNPDILFDEIVNKKYLYGIETPALYDRASIEKNRKMYTDEIKEIQRRYIEIKTGDTSFVDKLLAE